MHIKQAIMQTPMRPAVAALVRLLVDMVVGCSSEEGVAEASRAEAYRRGHRHQEA